MPDDMEPKEGLHAVGIASRPMGHLDQCKLAAIHAKFDHFGSFSLDAANGLNSKNIFNYSSPAARLIGSLRSFQGIESGRRHGVFSAGTAKCEKRVPYNV